MTSWPTNWVNWVTTFIDRWQLSWVELCRYRHFANLTQLNSTRRGVELSCVAIPLYVTWWRHHRHWHLYESISSLLPLCVLVPCHRRRNGLESDKAPTGLWRIKVPTGFRDRVPVSDCGEAVTKLWTNLFLFRRDAMHKCGLCRRAVSIGLSVCPSVCLSRSCIVSKRVRLFSNFFTFC